MNHQPATINPAPPLRGENVHDQPQGRAAVRITIPGRPQGRARQLGGPHLKGKPSAAAHAYREAVRDAARRAGLGKNGHPHAPSGFIALWLTFVYASPKLDLPPTAWPAENIPNAHRAPEITLLALEGLAYTRVSQVNPLIVIRTVLLPDECLAKYQSRDGATIVEIEG